MPPPDGVGRRQTSSTPESQFESYRALGQHIAEALFEQSVDEVIDQEGVVPPEQGIGEWHQRWCRGLFAALVRRWFAMPPEYEKTFVEATQGFIGVQEAFRKDARLWRLTLDLYPELDPAGTAVQEGRETMTERAARHAAELNILAQMVQVMENAYLSLNLDANYAHPMNRGWMDVFHRWTSAETFRFHWPHLRAEFGRDFVRFCERQMRMGVVTGTPVPLAPDEPRHRLTRLLTEFENQWPKRRADLEGCLKLATAGRGPLAWAIYPVNFSQLPADPQAKTESVPAGVILVWPAADDLGAQSCPVYDLFVWLRGSYRNTGLGRPAVRQILDQLQKRWPGPFRLRVRLPVADLTGPGGKLQKAMWLTFFYQLDFVRAHRPSAAPGHQTELELQRDFP
jgi:hypothetical protein